MEIDHTRHRIRQGTTGDLVDLRLSDAIGGANRPERLTEMIDHFIMGQQRGFAARNGEETMTSKKMTKREQALDAIRIEVAQTGEVSPLAVRLYVENRISKQAFDAAVAAGRAQHARSAA